MGWGLERLALCEVTRTPTPGREVRSLSGIGDVVDLTLPNSAAYAPDESSQGESRSPANARHDAVHSVFR